MNFGWVKKSGFALLLLLLVLWGGGFVTFLDTVSTYHEPDHETLATSEAVVVLTGGSERLMTGLWLLQTGKGQKLFVSGVYPSVTLETIKGYRDVPEETKSCCIELGYEAGNTAGNAKEVKAYMTRQSLRSMILVTANYHMPRSLLLLKREMPEIEIVPYPVTPDTVDLSNWWRRIGTASLLALEYCKYLYAFVRVW
ncbi:MAG: YdcF family protein [Alphaproteobacteria bacterium]|nr:YdcF family protein [Alphaproteobacteria bacterium]